MYRFVLACCGAAAVVDAGSSFGSPVCEHFTDQLPMSVLDTEAPIVDDLAFERLSNGTRGAMTPGSSQGVTFDIMWTASLLDIRTEILLVSPGARQFLNTEFAYATEQNSYERLLQSSARSTTMTLQIGRDLAWALPLSRADSNVPFATNNMAQSENETLASPSMLGTDSNAAAALFIAEPPRSLNRPDVNDLSAQIALVPTPHAALLAMGSLGMLSVLGARRRRH
ncbi:MAG: hypothetical protein AAF085_10020 [Planctomycetota bacterium]